MFVTCCHIWFAYINEFMFWFVLRDWLVILSCMHYFMSFGSLEFIDFYCKPMYKRHLKDSSNIFFSVLQKKECHHRFGSTWGWANLHLQFVLQCTELQLISSCVLWKIKVMTLVMQVPCSTNWTKVELTFLGELFL